ncbi:MAG: ABC transporter ATP-binding protein [Thermoleophilia bacterium]
MEARGVRHRFDGEEALKGVDLAVSPGHIHALLGPNGAGKTTLLRAVMGLLVPSEGTISVLGENPASRDLGFRRRVGFVPSGDRSLYLRISGLENLRFFARLHGLPWREARSRVAAAIEDVGLTDAARRPVSTYSHGMQKRLSVARTLLTRPEVLLVDEATHDLDPEAADQVRALVRDIADRGTAVIWTTQRIDEIRGFAEAVTLLRRGEVCFDGSVPGLMEHARMRGYLLRLDEATDADDLARLRGAVEGMGTLEPSVPGSTSHLSLALADDVILGDAIARLVSAGAQVISCTEERSALEEAFRSLTGDPGT